MAGTDFAPPIDMREEIEPSLIVSVFIVCSVKTNQL